MKVNTWAKPLAGLAGLPRYTVLYGGRGGGKDYAVAQEVLLAMMEKPMRVVVVRQFQNTISESMKALVETVMANENWDKRFRSTRVAITCKETGSVMHFQGAHVNAQSIKGWESYDLCLVNEAQSIRQEAWDILVPTIRKPGSRFILMMNPRFPHDPVAKEFLGPRLEGVKREDTLLVPVSWEDNRFLSEEAKFEAVRLRDADPQRYEHIWGGGYDRGSVHSPFDVEAVSDLALRSQIADGGQDNLLAGVDIAVTESAGADYTAAVWGTKDGLLLGYDRFKDGDYRRQVSKLAAMLGRCRSAFVDSTGVGNTISKMLADECKGRPAIVPIYWTPREKVEMVGTLAGFLSARAFKLAIGPNWEPMIDELRHYERHYTTDGLATPRYAAAPGYHDDLVSALMMYAKAVRVNQPAVAARSGQVWTVDGEYAPADVEVEPRQNGAFAVVGKVTYDARRPWGGQRVGVGAKRDWF